MGFAERLKQDAFLVAEGFVFELGRRGFLSRGAFVPEVLLEKPEVVLELQHEFIRAGSEAALVLGYYAHREKMKAIGRISDLPEINRTAACIARQAAFEYPDTLIAGNICNTGAYNPRDRRKSERAVREIFAEQLSWQAEKAGLDFVVAETFPYFGEAYAALQVIQEFGLPAVVTLASHENKYGRNFTLDGYPVGDACRRLEEKGAAVVGLNCSRGPGTMLPLLKEVRKAVKGEVAALPVPYRTTRKYISFWDLPRKNDRGKKAFPDHLDPYLLDLSEITRSIANIRALGVRYIGLCCGASPEMVRAIAESLGRTPPASRYTTRMEEHYVFGKKAKRFNKR